MDIPVSVSGRTCTKCAKWKDKDNFSVTKWGTLQSWCKKCINEKNLESSREVTSDPEKAKIRAGRNRASKRRLKEEVIRAYGSVCACCGEDTYEFLTLDHVNDDGAAHRRENNLRTGAGTWTWARRNNFPDILQLLCWNCNSSKGAFGYCPHQL